MSKVLLSKDQQYLLKVTEDLFKPRGDGLKVGLENRLHKGQIDAIRPYMNGTIQNLMLPCGRKFGKTEVVGFILWHKALFQPGSACYYVAPENSHARQLIWQNNRIQKFLGKDSATYIKSIKNQEMVIEFKNGSFIKLIGSENWSAANGLTPDIAVYDEFKAFHPQWHVEFAPNRAAKGAPLVIIGTLPKVGDRNMDQYNHILEYMKQDSSSKVIYKTTFDNPINHLPAQKKVIEEEIAQLRARGEEDVVQREYYSKIVPGGSKAVFPMLDEERHLFPHKKLIDEIKRDRKKLQWFVSADPGTTTCFAVLFGCLNPYNKRMYILDEIYEKDQLKTTSRQICERIKSIAETLYPESDINDDWFKVYDEAGAWFASEALAGFDMSFFKTEKTRGDKEEGLSVIKDQLIYEVVKISDRCKNLFEEMQKYAKDYKGVIPKKNDHLIDAYRYLIQASNYDFNTIKEAIKRIEPMEQGRFRSVYHDENEIDLDTDWTLALGEEFDL